VLLSRAGCSLALPCFSCVGQVCRHDFVVLAAGRCVWVWFLFFVFVFESMYDSSLLLLMQLYAALLRVREKKLP
jgi:hypothetical protein